MTLNRLGKLARLVWAVTVLVAMAAAASNAQTAPSAAILPASGPTPAKLTVPSTAPTVVITDDGDEAARVWLTYDSQALHVVYKVVDTSPLKNSGDNWRMYFKTGDLCDLQFSVPEASSAQPHDGMRPGDIRLEFVPAATGPVTVAVRYKLLPGWPAAPQSDNVVNGWTYSSPTGQFQVDRVEVLPAVKVETRAIPDGYILSAVVPWKALLASGQLPPKAGDSMTGDVGVLFSDPDGQQTVERVYWANHDTAVVADVPTEARITPRNWGTFRFGPGAK